MTNAIANPFASPAQAPAQTAPAAPAEAANPFKPATAPAAPAETPAPAQEAPAAEAPAPVETAATEAPAQEESAEPAKTTKKTTGTGRGRKNTAASKDKTEAVSVTLSADSIDALVAELVSTRPLPEVPAALEELSKAINDKAAEIAKAVASFLPA